jgi:hypothetical protein
MPLDRSGTMTETEPWTCPTCNSTVSTPYCPGCGERPLRERELTLRGIFNQLVQAFTNLDGRLIRSFRCLVRRPGFLTVAYLQGQRKPYVGPVPLFLIANALFFATESLTGGKVFTTPIDSHLHTQPWSRVAELLVSHRLEAMQTTLGAHALFSLHVYAFLLLLFCVATVVPPIDLWFGGVGFGSDRLDHVISIALLLACGVYLHVRERFTTPLAPVEFSKSWRSLWP